MRLSLFCLSIGLLAAWPSAAGTLTCNFTEPFYTITFDSASGEVVETTPNETDENTGQPIPTVLAKAAKLVAVEDPEALAYHLDEGSKTILELRLTGQGTDGMSDSVYPFEAKYGDREGACETGKYPAFDPYQVMEDLGVSSQ